MNGEGLFCDHVSGANKQRDDDDDGKNADEDKQGRFQYVVETVNAVFGDSPDAQSDSDRTERHGGDCNQNHGQSKFEFKNFSLLGRGLFTHTGIIARLLKKINRNVGKSLCNVCGITVREKVEKEGNAYRN